MRQNFIKLEKKKKLQSPTSYRVHLNVLPTYSPPIDNLGRASTFPQTIPYI